jgi:hypothetical protein
MVGWICDLTTSQFNTIQAFAEAVVTKNIENIEILSMDSWNKKTDGLFSIYSNYRIKPKGVTSEERIKELEKENEKLKEDRNKLLKILNGLSCEEKL